MTRAWLGGSVLSIVLSLQCVPGTARAEDSRLSQAHPTVLFDLQEAQIQARGMTRVEWNYDFLRGNHPQRIFNDTQTITGTRSQHRKTHLVTWRLKHGLTDRLQPEAEVVYQAFRQHTHGDRDIHDRNDDGNFERVLAGLSYQLLRESPRAPDVRLRSGILIPSRGETEGIGQELGCDLLGSVAKRLGETRATGAVGFAMTFDNHDHPADPVFNNTPISKGHALRTLTYGLGLAHPLTPQWQANLELDGRVFDTIELNERLHRSELTLTPGLLYRRTQGHQEWWMGLGLHIGLTTDTDHLGVAVRTGLYF